MTATVLFTKSQACIEPTSGYLPLVILHGLFGNWENWGARIRHYVTYTDVHAMDLRNHGDSPHLDTMNYREMAEDVVATLDQLGLDKCVLLGHSMGGKVAMQVATSASNAISDRITRLILVDIAPKPYPPHHQIIIDALSAIDIEQLKSRREADQQLSAVVKEQAIRAFLLKNLVRKDVTDSDASTGFRWQFNLPALRDNYSQLMLAPEPGKPFEGPTLFIKGAESDYLQDADKEAVLKAFPRAKLKVIGGSGHWPHAEKPDSFDRIVTRFLEYT